LIVRCGFAEMASGLGHTMKWKKDRDLLIAQTLAFVQSVTAKATEGESQFEPITRLEPIPSDEPANPEPPAHHTAGPARPAAPARPASSPSTDFREEIRRRVAAFRAHQELFNRDRDEYFKSVLAKARSAAGRPSGASADQPDKR
jgi:hypothetical protein